MSTLLALALYYIKNISWDNIFSNKVPYPKFMADVEKYTIASRDIIKQTISQTLGLWICGLNDLIGWDKWAHIEGSRSERW